MKNQLPFEPSVVRPNKAGSDFVKDYNIYVFAKCQIVALNCKVSPLTGVKVHANIAKISLA